VADRAWPGGTSPAAEGLELPNGEMNLRGRPILIHGSAPLFVCEGELALGVLECRYERVCSTVAVATVITFGECTCATAPRLPQVRSASWRGERVRRRSTGSRGCCTSLKLGHRCYGLGQVGAREEVATCRINNAGAVRRNHFSGELRAAPYALSTDKSRKRPRRCHCLAPSVRNSSGHPSVTVRWEAVTGHPEVAETVAAPPQRPAE
jgi:hypothetical protein